MSFGSLARQPDGSHAIERKRRRPIERAGGRASHGETSDFRNGLHLLQYSVVRLLDKGEKKKEPEEKKKGRKEKERRRRA